MLERLHADKVMQQGARSSVVNGPFTGSKERRSFKPKVASSILVGRIPQGSKGGRVLPMLEPDARLAPRITFRAFPAIPGIDVPAPRSGDPTCLNTTGRLRHRRYELPCPATTLRIAPSAAQSYPQQKTLRPSKRFSLSCSTSIPPN
jgi:hypothetical protein